MVCLFPGETVIAIVIQNKLQQMYTTYIQRLHQVYALFAVILVIKVFPIYQACYIIWIVFVVSRVYIPIMNFLTWINFAVQLLSRIVDMVGSVVTK